MASLSEEAQAGEKVERLEEALRKAKRKLATREDDREAWVRAVKEGAAEAALTLGVAAPVPRPERDRRRSPEVAVLHLTDWQLGKVTESYDTKVCHQRIDLAIDKTRKLRQIQHADHPVREIHVLFGGDLVEGLGIFPGQAYEVDSTNISQVMEAKFLMVRSLLSLLEDFEHVHVWEVAGNHGRIGRRGDFPREFNLDRLVSELARAELAEQPRLTWNVPAPKDWYAIVTIENYTAMLVHGDQVKSFGGNLPAYGIMRKANAWAAGAIPESFRDIYIGHLHQPMTLQMAHGGLVYMTPSPESGSAYAREFAGAHGRPGQRLHFIDGKRGRVTASYLLELDD